MGVLARGHLAIGKICSARGIKPVSPWDCDGFGLLWDITNSATKCGLGCLHLGEDLERSFPLHFFSRPSFSQESERFGGTLSSRNVLSKVSEENGERAWFSLLTLFGSE